ncbi:hypothetical protein BD779DRAFT_1475255 [Infundibulicybe gibba]|nr:hypothetical protein BD779DRAFT_1475255 [Infundibulicybe gibba]
MTASQSDTPPPFDPVNVVEINSITDGKIINVNLYSGRAEITRLYKVNARTGQNKFKITGLPDVLDHDSVRVEGRGSATIHDVIMSEAPVKRASSTSPALEALKMKRSRTKNALDRCNELLASLGSYLGTAHVKHIAANDLGSFVDNYTTTCERLDERVIELKQELEVIDADLKAARDALGIARESELLRQQIAISVFVEVGGDVEVVLIYAVWDANWEAAYDIRVETDSKEAPVTLIYKAMITQSTGESWNDIPLTLETATPMFGVEIPSLSNWNISVYRAQPRHYSQHEPQPSIIPLPQLRHSAPGTIFPGSTRSHSRASASPEPPMILHRGLHVSSKGNVSATFKIPGLISIPSDGKSHNITIVELKLDAAMSWVAIPKQDAKVHLKAKIKNASEYTLLQGSGSVYVDGSFISRSNVPLVSPQESFDCPLGLDPTIRITYHPRSKKTTHSGLYRKTINHAYSQRITIFNTKTIPIKDLKVVDQIPVSEDSQVTVKLTSPALTLPVPASENSKNSNNKVLLPVSVTKGVSAQWDGADEDSVDRESLGRNGRLNWMCEVPAQEKVNLVLSWEVTASANTPIIGL